MVSPMPVDVKESGPLTFEVVARLLRNATGGSVLRAKIYLNSVKAQYVESVLGHHHNGLRSDSSIGESLIDPVSDVGPS